MGRIGNIINRKGKQDAKRASAVSYTHLLMP